MFRGFFAATPCLAILAACASSTPSTPVATAPDAGDPVAKTVNSASPPDADAPAAVTAGPDATVVVTDAGADASDGAAIDLAPYRLIGRYDARDAAGPRFGWSGTQLRADFTGAGISIDLADTGHDQFDVSIDGAAPTLLLVTGARQTYSLATGLAAGNHELVLTKRTESSVGITQLFAIGATLIGTPPALTATTRRIEMIGDSITNGYGILGADQTCTFSPGTEDESIAWGALAATELHAAHTAIAWSGIGLYRNYDGTLTGTMPALYSLAVATDVTSAWTPSAFEPDVVVVNLGTNDFAGAASDPGPNFQATLVTFLGTIRTAHPSAKIVLATSPMLSGTFHAAQMAYLQGATAARNDAAISMIDLAVPPAANGFGCDSHPSTVTQQEMATTLVAQIKSVTGW